MENKQSCKNYVRGLWARSSPLSRLFAAICRLSRWLFRARAPAPGYIWRPRYWVGGVGFCCGAVNVVGWQILAMEYLPELYRNSYPYDHWTARAVPLALLAVWLPFEISRVYRKERLHNNLCRSCGYDIRKLTADRCPECGCPDLAESRRQLEETYGVFWIGALFRAYFAKRDKEAAEK